MLPTPVLQVEPEQMSRFAIRELSSQSPRIDRETRGRMGVVDKSANTCLGSGVALGFLIFGLRACSAAPFVVSS